MKKLSKKSTLLLVSVMALATFAMPSLASAATWSAPGLITGHSSSLALTATSPLGNYTVNCTTQFTGDAVNTAGVAAGSITSTTFGTLSAPCSGGGPVAGCVADTVATNLPWAITTSGTTVTISGMQATLTFRGSCPLAGLVEVIEGAVTGEWANGSGTANTLTLANAGGLGLTLSGNVIGTVALDGGFNVTGPHL